MGFLKRFFGFGSKKDIVIPSISFPWGYKRYYEYKLDYFLYFSTLSLGSDHLRVIRKRLGHTVGGMP